MDQSRIDALLNFYATLTADRVKDFGTYYADDAYFKDPFNEVTRLADIREIFARMFRQLVDPQFIVSENIGDQRGHFLIWEMRFCLKSWRPAQNRIVRGVSHLRFNSDGKVIYHRDYWDTGEELYAKLPLIGAAIRFLQRTLG